MESTQSTEHMYLVFARERYFDVALGTSMARYSVKSEDSALESYWNEHVRPVELEAGSEWDKELDEWRSETRTEEFQVKEGPRGKRISVKKTRVTLPDGRTIEAKAFEADSKIWSEFERSRGGRPLVHRDWQHWRASCSDAAKPQVSQHRGWKAFVYFANGECEQISDLDMSYPFGAPLIGILSALDRYGRQGWSVVSSSEDKGLYQGHDAPDEAFPTRVRFLLARTTR